MEEDGPEKLSPSQRAAMAAGLLEDVMRRALDEALPLKGTENPFEQGRLFAFFEVIDWIKVSAETDGITPFDDPTLNGIDPYSLLEKAGPEAP